MARQVKSKYNFASVNVDDTIYVKADDMMSMTNSLNAYNRRHKKSVKIVPADPDQEIKMKRVK